MASLLGLIREDADLTGPVDTVRVAK